MRFIAVFQRNLVTFATNKNKDNHHVYFQAVL